MTQRAQVIDITKSYLPGDPNAFVQNLINTEREDGEEKTLPILPYEGYNFLPTSYGYRSYFGVNTILDVGILSSNVQFILSYQLQDYTTILIALCEDGIWTLDANTASAPWVQVITFNLLTPAPFYTPGTFEEWTWCVIENVLYMYQQGRPTAWKTSESGGVLSIVTHTPNFLNMAGQMGIFKAGLRLGFWDSANSVSWSSNLTLTDMTPALETLAGNTIFGDVIGRIITIRAHGEGFIVYCTKAAVGVNFDGNGNLLWDAKKIFDNVGISYSRAVTYGQSDAEHFVYATNGIYRIGKFNALAGKHDLENIVPEVYDFLRESRDPIYLDTVNSRYVFFHILNPDYVYGLTSFTYVTPEDLNVRFLIGGHPWDGEDLPAICMDGNAAAEAIRQLVTFGFVSADESTALWTPITVETQADTNGPLDDGGSRAAQALGFTTQDVIDTYIEGNTLPAEIVPTPEEHPEIVTEHLGNAPFGSVISGAGSKTLSRIMYDQSLDWELFKIHQTAAFAAISAASKVVTTAGVSPFYALNVAGLPALPADSVTDTVIGTYKTGNGNTELQRDAPLRMLRLRKYFQEGRTITKRRSRTYAWRQAGTVPGYSITWAGVNCSHINPNFYTPDDVAFTATAAALTQGDAITAMKAALYALAAGSNTGQNTGSVCPKLAIGSSTFNASVFTSNFRLSYTTDPLSGVSNQYYGEGQELVNATLNVYYQDIVDTYTYIIGPAVTQDMGYAEFKATQVKLARTIIQVTSDPPTVVVHSFVPIFPTGPSAVTFFPPVWEGEETLTIIAASALSPWHHVDGTFGIELIGSPTVNATEQLLSLGGCSLTGNPFIGADFGVTYSSFPYVLQVGSPFIYYPTFAGALVLDLALKKWGKQKNNYQILIDLQPINQFNHTILTANDRGMDAALQLVDETIKIFDDEPDDSRLTYGKFGNYRLGMSNILEVKALNRRACTGVLTIDSSMDGRTIDASLRYTLAYGSANIVEAYPDISARWHVVTMSGIFDLTGLEARLIISGRR